MRIGYARISTAVQKLDLQTDALAKAEVDRVFTDTMSGAKSKRPGLDALLDHVREGDTVVVWRLDRLGRSTPDLIRISGELEAKGVQLVSLSENIDTSTISGKLLFHIMAALAEFERNTMLDRTRAGLEAAKARGKFGGRPPALSPEKQAAVLAMWDGDQRPTQTAIAAAVGVGEKTIRRFLKKSNRT